MTDQVTEETEIFSIRPSMRGYAVVIIFGVVTLPFMGLGAILIIMAWLKTKSAAYRMTTQRLFTRDGILSRSVNEMELYRVKDVSYSQGFIQRMLGVDRKSTRLNSSHIQKSRMPSSA